MNTVEGINASLVTFSIYFLVITVYTVLNMVAHVSGTTKRKERLLWLLISAFIIGVLIWTMHLMDPQSIEVVSPSHASIHGMYLTLSMGIGAIIILLITPMIVLLNQKTFTQSNQLKTMEQYYESLFDQNPDLILTFDLDGRFLRANRVVELYGYQESELLGRSFSPFIHVDCLEQTMKNFLTAVQGVTITYDTTIYQKNGLFANMNVTNIPIFVDGNVVGIYAILKDMTRRRQTEQTLIEVESKYRSLLEESGKYSSEMNQLVQDKMQTETDLRKALDKGEFIVHYQPQVHLRTGKIIGVEALVRWQHPERGSISPATFIPIAEETGLIVPIGEWILHEACLQNKQWQELGLPSVVISVNLSPRQFLNSHIVNTVARVLNETGLPANYLELEITEGMAMDVNRTHTVLQELKKLGVKISLDDFGTGYSSLHYLQKFPIDTLKIDQSFIRACNSDLNHAAIVKTIIAMAHSMNLHVIAEGVETEEQLSFLQHHLCDAVQGYLFSKPVSSHDFVREFMEIERKAKDLGISAEVSDRLQIEEELRRTRQNFEEAVRNQEGMTLKFTKQSGRFIHTLCDGKLLYRMGLTPEHVVGKVLEEFLPTDVADVKSVFYERAWQGEQHVVYEGMINGIVYIATLRPVIRGGKVVEVIASCVDITERKQAEEALREREAQYRLIAEHMTDLVGVSDRNGVVIYASPSHLDVLGLSPEMLEGTSAFDMVHPEDVLHVQKQFAKMIASGRPIKTEFRYMHHDGYFVYVEANGNPVYDENGEFLHSVIVSRDITERKKTEELLSKTEALSALGELAAGVAHEIRNPLTTIKGFVQLLTKGDYKPTYTPIVMDELTRIEIIIQEFLLLGKHQVIPNQLFDIGELVKQVTRVLETQTILKRIVMHLEIEPGLPMMNGKDIKLKQVFVNLLRNAIDAMGDKGGEIRIQIHRQEEGFVLIRITDLGSGMDEEQKKRLGKPFYSNKAKGTGLGLMVCYQIIQEHHGHIHFQSEVNQGTTVEVMLPMDLSIAMEPYPR